MFWASAFSNGILNYVSERLVAVVGGMRARTLGDIEDTLEEPRSCGRVRRGMTVLSSHSWLLQCYLYILIIYKLVLRIHILY